MVRELWEARDAIAREADLSPRRVLADQAIIEARTALGDEHHAAVSLVAVYHNLVRLWALA